MPNRKVILATGEYYHIYNRGVAKQPIFKTQRDYQRFLQTMIFYQVEKPATKFSDANLRQPSNRKSLKVDIICYCLMPNHFHLLLKQNSDNGISTYMSRVSNSFTRYFNTRHDRVGPLFQGRFKAVHIESNEQLIHLSRYIHLNPLVNFIVVNLRHYKWSSFTEYIHETKNNYCSKDIILKQFSSPSLYDQFIIDNEKYARSLEMIKHQCIDGS